MIIQEAEAILGDVLDPLPLETFYQALGRITLDARGGPGHPRARLFGEDPAATALGAYATHAARLDCHAVKPGGPPPGPREVDGREAFLGLIRAYHERGYTVRLPEVVALSPPLRLFARALELVLHQPVDASLFWSRAGAGAIVHYDRRDNLVVQLSGRKRWYVSTDPPGLQNNWKQVDEPPPHLQRHRVVDLEPGDLLYIPRGTPHTVEGDTESLHLAILFVPVTLRDAVIAAVDFLSDLDRSWRETIVARPGSTDLETLSPAVARGLERLLGQCRSGAFVGAAMEQRSSRIVGDLPALARPGAVPQLGPDSRVRHAHLAVCHLRHSRDRIDFSMPGGHVAIHPGVEEELRFIERVSEFRIGDMTGSAAMEVRLALVGRLVAEGFLEPVEPGGG
ncbi:MAG TPA: cupin domain-containing protein [Allosphingosinicella sp.]|jgi:mannose-6-phosphate isomerase-like protein (cupin superfamily)|nr:cupin domain-containing protein [Allosphingosinicella sp.]